MHIDAKQKGTGAIQEHQHNNNSWQHLWMKHTQHTESTGKQTVRTLIRKSRDKLFSIKYTIGTTNSPQWYVVQAKLRDDDESSTRDEGK